MQGKKGVRGSPHHMKLKQGHLQNKDFRSGGGGSKANMNLAEALGWHREGRNITADQSGVKRA